MDNLFKWLNEHVYTAYTQKKYYSNVVYRSFKLQTIILVNLRELDLHGNSIDNIPKELFDLYQLQKLNMNNNRIVEISREIGKLKNLRTLSLYANSISEISDELFQLVYL